ncbi:MAG: DUF4298 domain-containing protein [Clostridia bacterium]|nr:DUF4298 domain-containing protein [Clostridia bacterium]
MKRIDRIKAMENSLDVSAGAIEALAAALEKYEEAMPEWKKLSDYYGSTQWMRDYEADEAGKLPKDLKRGVLSEDTVYDLIIDNRDLVARMAKLVAKSIDDNTI